ncbi:diacylglycerol O-acyltransferase 2-like protein 6 [Planococcus citri]|uniref:diacylglycerol O-acyltransferase 2-like protein 6 n=1 Tax=Planococcus citri TaxID=170843 RepID=UPI0031F81170
MFAQVDTHQSFEMNTKMNDDAKETDFVGSKIDVGAWNKLSKEHLQTLSVALNLFLGLSGTTLVPILLIYIFFYTRLWFLVPLYLAWIYYDRKTGFTGGRKLNWFRRSKMFEYFRDYFPCRLIKTQNLEADRNYLFVVYPHGMFALSTICCFCTEANSIESRVFPGLDFRIVTIDAHVCCPITREYCLSMGCIGSRESSILHVLNSKPSKAVVLVPGGGAEMQITEPGSTYRIITSRRKGFVRLALKTGTPLVPVFSFGEQNLYSRYQSKWLQKMVKKITGIYDVVPKGRMGILPYRHPVNTVVGKPIHVPKIENPSTKDIDEYHAKFVQELTALFEDNKCKYDVNKSNAELINL